MAVKIRRSYKGAAVAAVLDSSGVTSATQTSITLTTSPSTWPTGKFFVVVAPGTAQEEKMCVTISGSTLTVVDPAVTSTSASANGRGVDNTTARSAIAGGSTVYPVFTAVDADEANELTSTYSAQGHIVYQGASTFAGLGIGTAGQALKVNAGATAPEWGQISTAGLADGGVTLAKLASALQELLVPVGTVSPYAGTSAPAAWVLCHGQELAIASYAGLYAVCGTTYGSLTDGSGNAGSTHFRVPDLRGRVVAGQDDMGGTSANRLTGQTGGIDGDVLGGTGGAETHTLTTAQIPSHSHIMDISSTTGANNQVVAIGGTYAQGLTTSATGGGGAHNNVQPTIILNYIIKT